MIKEEVKSELASTNASLIELKIISLDCRMLPLTPNLMNATSHLLYTSNAACVTRTRLKFFLF